MQQENGSTTMKNAYKSNLPCRECAPERRRRRRLRQWWRQRRRFVSPICILRRRSSRSPITRSSSPAKRGDGPLRRRPGCRAPRGSGRSTESNRERTDPPFRLNKTEKPRRKMRRRNDDDDEGEMNGVFSLSLSLVSLSASLAVKFGTFSVTLNGTRMRGARFIATCEPRGSLFTTATIREGLKKIIHFSFTIFFLFFTYH